MNRLEWGVAERPLAGERVSGDAYLVQFFADKVLLAVADGLGHGIGAAEASRRAMDILKEYAHESLAVSVKRCHSGLQGTRGTALSVAVVDLSDGKMTWLGVGNVEAVLLRAGEPPRREAILLRGGVVGYELPTLRPSEERLSPGDTLVFATDGIRGSFTEMLSSVVSPQDLANRIMMRYRKETDDALVLVARYRRNLDG